MVRYLRNDELMHYGRSKDDGAPGVGTGNWRRSDDHHYADNSLSFKGVSEFSKKAKKYRLKKRKEDLARLQRDYDYINKVKIDKYGRAKPTIGGKLSRFISDRKLAKAEKKADKAKEEVEKFTGEEFESSASKYDIDAKISNQQAYDLLNETIRESLKTVNKKSPYGVKYNPKSDSTNYQMSDLTKAYWKSKEKVEKLFPNSKDEVYNQFFRSIVDTTYPLASTTIPSGYGNSRWEEVQMLAGWKPRNDAMKKRIQENNARAEEVEREKARRR